MTRARHPFLQNPPLPMRDGVSPSHAWLPMEESWPDMLAFLAQRFPKVEEAAWRDRMARGEVRYADGSVIAPDTAYRRGHCIFYYRELDSEPSIPHAAPFDARILYRDDHLLVADKPHFLPMTPGGRYVTQTLLVRLKQQTGLAHLVPIHRLDRETAGVVIFSHNPASRGIYQSMFQKRVVEKVYHAVAPRIDGHDFPFTYRSRLEQDEQFFRMREAGGEANSETLLELIAEDAGLGLYRLSPHTGRQHQLRVHMAALGMPILHDGFYPQPLPVGADDFARPLQLLAREISFIDPLDGRRRHFASERTLAFAPVSPFPAEGEQA